LLASKAGTEYAKKTRLMTVRPTHQVPMNDGSGPLSIPIRIAAAVLGAYLLAGGLGLAGAGVTHLPRLWILLLEGVRTVFLGASFVVAAKTGTSPAGPD